MNTSTAKFILKTNFMKTMEKFNVQQIKTFLKEKNASTTGNKSELLLRLAEILQEENIDPQSYADEKYKALFEVRPENSISQVASNPTGTRPKSSLSKRSSLSNHSIRSERVKETAKKAALEAR